MLAASVLFGPFIQVATASTFGNGGVAIPPIYIPGSNSIPTAVIQQADGSIIVAGTADGPIDSTMFAARFTAAGVLDTTYGIGGIAFVPYPDDAIRLRADAAILDSHGNLILAGQVQDRFLFANMAVARLTKDGVPDSAFGTNGLLIVTSEYPFSSYATSAILDLQGRVLVAGYARGLTGQGFAVVRLDASGALDTTLDPTGLRIVSLSMNTGAAGSVVVDTNGNILLSGFDGSSSATPLAIIRVTPNGQLDTSFNGTGVAYFAQSDYSSHFPIAIDSFGKVLLARVLGASGQQVLSLVRLTGSGSIDLSFGSGGSAQAALPSELAVASVGSLTMDQVGRITVSVKGYNQAAESIGVLRFLVNGSIDTSFNGAGIRLLPSAVQMDSSVAMAIDANDSVVLAVPQNTGTYATKYDVALTRLTSAGALDSTFNDTGTLVSSCGILRITPSAIVQQPDGKWVLGAYTGDPGSGPETIKFLIVRLSGAGALDTAFNGTGFRVVDIPSLNEAFLDAVVLDRAGNIIIAGHDAPRTKLALARLAGDGSLDKSFNGTGVLTLDGYASRFRGPRSVALDMQNNIVLVDVGGTSLTRVAPTGTFDIAFIDGGAAVIPFDGGGGGGEAFDSLGRLVIAGTDYTSGPRSFFAARLTNAGGLDGTFANAGTGTIAVPPSEQCIALSIDGIDRIHLVGDSGTVVRLTSSGALDSSFNGSGVNHTKLTDIYAAALDNAGRLLVAGETNAYNLSAMFAQRFTSGGMIDDSFNGGQPVKVGVSKGNQNVARAIAVDPSGGIYLAGTVGRSMGIVKLYDGAPTNVVAVATGGGLDLVATVAFGITILSQDDAGIPQTVSKDTNVGLSLIHGNSVLNGSMNCTILNGTNSCLISGVTYSQVEQGVTIAAAVISGDPLEATESQFNVGPSPTVTTLVSNINPSLVGQLVTFTATVTGIDPVGNVAFDLEGSPLTGCEHVPLNGSGNSKTATCSTVIPFGQHGIDALYSSSNALNNPSTATISQVVIEINVALSSNGGVATASSTFSASFPASAIINNERAGALWGNGGGWNDVTGNVFPDWVQINFNGNKTIDRVVVYTVQDNYANPVEPTDAMTFSLYGITAFAVQGWNGSAWVTLGSVSGNNLVKRTVTFSPYTTTRIRISVADALASYSRITEVEAWGTPAVGPPPAAITLASSLNPSAVGASINFTATVVGTTPTGTVNFTDGGTSIGGCSAMTLTGSGNSKTAQCTTIALTAATHSLVANYSGDSANAASASTPLSQVVNAVGSVNVALASNGGVATASSTISPAFPASSINNGERAGVNWGNGGGWNDASGNAYPDWVQIAFNGSKTIDRVVVYTVQDNYANPVEPTDTQTFSLYGVTSFTVQGKQGKKWVTLATVAGNNLVKRTVNFAPFATDRIRVNVTNALASYSRITEVEAWGR